MRRAISLFFLILSLLSQNSIVALHRDYAIYDIYNELETYNYLDDNDLEIEPCDLFYCVDHYWQYGTSFGKSDIYNINPNDPLPHIDIELLRLLPQYLPEARCVACLDKEDFHCKRCRKPVNYQGYLDPDFRIFNFQLEQQLSYFQTQPDCECYWPELSEDAAQVSDQAYLLFEELFRTTFLKSLINNQKEQNFLIGSSYWNLNLHGLSVAFVCQSFWFSHYYNVCLLLSNYVETKLLEGKIKYKDCIFIQAKLEEILLSLADSFKKIYINCLKEHPNKTIERELLFLTGLPNYQLFEINKKSLCNSNTFIRTIESPIGQSNNNRFFFDYYLIQGMFLNDRLLYKDAISCFDLALNFDNKNYQAYLARAYAFFELGDIEKALSDYQKAKDFKIVPPLKPQFSGSFLQLRASSFNYLEFSKGFIVGATQGVGTGAKEFIPSILYTISGIGQGFWAYLKEPINVSQDFIEVVTAYIEWAIAYLSPGQREILVSELKQLFHKWYDLKDYEKGHKIGFIIGKYGVDLLAVSGAIRGVRLYRELKYANAALTLDVCEKAKNRKLIITEVSKRQAFRKTLFKKGKIKINWDLQDRHFPNSRFYTKNRSYFTISSKKLEKLCIEKVGTGEAVNHIVMGECGFKERIDFGEIIGMYLTEEKNCIPKETKIGIVHYKINGFFHVVPGPPGVS